MKIKHMTNLLLLFTSLLLLTSCYFFGASRWALEQSLERSLTVGFQHQRTEEVTTDGDSYNKHFFIDDNGVEFFVYAQMFESHLFGSTIEVTTNYIWAVWLHGDIDQETREAAIHSELRDLGSTPNRVLIESYDQLEIAAESVYNLLHTVPPLTIDREVFRVRFHRNFSDMRVTSTQGAVLGTFDYLVVGEYISREEILETLSTNFIIHHRAGRIEEDLPPEVLLQYPVYVINEIYVNGALVSLCSIGYDRARGDFMLTSMNLCSLYTNNGNRLPWTFERLVTELGGTFASDENKAIWTIGNDRWEATLVEGERGSVFVRVYYEIYKNGEQIIQTEELHARELGGNRLGYNGVIFTLSELEHMLNVTVVIDRIYGSMNLISNSN